VNTEPTGPDQPITFRPAIVPPDAVEVMPGLWEWTRGDARICVVGVQADPLKNSMAWLERMRETMPADEFRRECLLDFDGPIEPPAESR
jgi:hypothetical protein